MKFPSKDSVIKFGSWDSLCLLWGMLGQVAYLSDLSKPYLHVSIFMILLMVPVSLIIFVQPDDFSKKVVARCHLFAALWYVVITLTTEILSLIGYMPKGSTLFRILMHFGWIPCFRIIRKVLFRKSAPSF